MKSSKKRDLSKMRLKSVMVRVDESVHEKLIRMAGPESLAVTVTELVTREWRRREKRLEQPAQ